jgi:hypothetical protein
LPLAAALVLPDELIFNPKRFEQVTPDRIVQPHLIDIEPLPWL